VFGDNGSYSVTVTVTDDDGGSDGDTVNVVVGNLPPTVGFDMSGAVAFPGGSYLVVKAGSQLPSSADGTDAGSDDLTFTWTVGDQSIYFNNGSTPDPLPSPFGTFPFHASDANIAHYAAPGVELLTVTLTDDDGGSDSEGGNVIVTGTAGSTEGSGWWKHQYAGDGSPQIDALTLAGYLEIVNAVSSVFSENVNAATSLDVQAILSPNAGDRRARARAELMVAWLQFASGAVHWNASVPIGGGATIKFLPLLFDAEATILNPGATNSQLQDVEQRLLQVRHAF
jgi:hypothetical protein